jgi:uncharacterized protein YneF (UPF0154 family)
MDFALFIYLMVVFVAIGGILLTRKLSAKRLETLMLEKSGNRLGATLAIDAEEVVAETPIEFNEINCNSITAEAVKQREFLIARARKVFWKMVLIDVVAGCGYISFSIIAHEMSVSQNSDDWLGGIGIGIILILLSFDRYFAFRNQYRAHQTGVSRIFRSVNQLRSFYNKPSYSIYYSGFAVFVILTVTVSSNEFPWQLRAGLLLAVALHVYLLIWLFTSYRTIRNYKLLILRVFGIDNNARFTFEGLWKYWQHFGSFLTVVDKTYVSRQVKIWRQIVFVLVLVAIVSVILHDDSLFQIRYRWVGVTIIIGLAIGFYINLQYNYRKIKKSFIGSKQDLDKRLKQIQRWPRKLSNTFKEVPVMCYDDTWKMAVFELIKIADSILMDLRGFSDERKGCQAEVNLLMDCVPLNRITFLVDPGSLNGVKKMISTAWAQLNHDSPNLKITAPTVNIYISEKQNHADIQGIMDLLLNATIFAPDAGGSGAEAAVQQPQVARKKN